MATPNVETVAGDIMDQPSLAERRPDWLEEHLTADFLCAAQLNPKDSYAWNGVNPSYQFVCPMNWLENALYDTDDLIGQLASRQESPLSILDVGTGAGSFVMRRLAEGHIAHGVSAIDYRTIPGLNRARHLDAPHYIVGDAHYLDRLPGLRAVYDLVVSRWCIDKLRDPLAALEQMAGRVAAGGVLAVDRFYLLHRAQPYWDWTPKDSDYTRDDLMGDLDRAGFRPLDTKAANYYGVVAAENEPGDIPTLIMQRDHADAPLRFSADYKTVTYIPDAPGFVYTKAA